jgi:hypothetical protein
MNNRKRVALFVFIVVALTCLAVAAGKVASASEPSSPCEKCCVDYAILRGAVIDAINVRERTGVTPEAREIVMRALTRTGERCRWLDQENGAHVAVFVCD